MNRLIASIRQIWLLTYPFFTSKDPTTLDVWLLGRLRVQVRWVALTFLAVVIGAEFAKVAINVRLSYFSRDWFNAIQDKNEAEFWRQLFMVFSFWAVIYVTVAIYQYAIRSYLTIRWRSWMTQHYIGAWLGEHSHYRMQLEGRNRTDNPDQRIQEDVQNFTQTTFILFLGILSSVSTLFSFAFVLWSLSADFTLPFTEIRIPGFLLWGALLYAVIGTWLTHVVGRPLIRLNFEQQRYEADFRFSLARIREYGEQIALLRGEPSEADQLRGRFGNVIGNFLQIVSRTKKLTALTAGYSQVSNVIPYVLVAPYYFGGKIALGGMTQTASAFGQVQSSLSFFVDAYSTLAEYKSVVDRLTSFDASVHHVRDAQRHERHVRLQQGAGRDMELSDLMVGLPNGQMLVQVDHLTLRQGNSVLLTGPSGTGKSTLFRAISGIWPFGDGRVVLPQGQSMMLLPQRPYLPMGTLREAVSYPSQRDAYSDATIAEALRAAKLPQIADKLDEERAWGQTLSLGEQQRLAVARALLAKPDWLFLDEATAALDEATEAEIYQILKEKLPHTTLVSIGHRSTLAAFHDRRLDLRRAEDGLSTPVDMMQPQPAE
ncbi:ABC transporter ATP-binding protein/permease [Microvirga sp. TS319]|uniref:ABC transporter ATP-binding protein/permease n=1 Tax=Microvirga sp. TS319 TaxID=3241165 RepID=UPI00351A50BD